MLKSLILSLLFLPFLAFSQVVNEDYEIYSKVISEQLHFGNTSQIDSIVLINKYIPKFPQEFDDVIDFTNDSIPGWTISFLWTQTNRNDIFIKKIKHDIDLRNAIKEFAANFNNHPDLNSELLINPTLNIQTITSKKFYSYFGRKFKRIDKSWEKIYKKYKSREVIALSTIKYYEQYALVYYERHCGGLCGTGNMVILEMKNKSWDFLAEINLWMS